MIILTAIKPLARRSGVDITIDMNIPLLSKYWWRVKCLKWIIRKIRSFSNFDTLLNKVYIKVRCKLLTCGFSLGIRSDLLPCRQQVLKSKSNFEENISVTMNENYNLIKYSTTVIEYQYLRVSRNVKDWIVLLRLVK